MSVNVPFQSTSHYSPQQISELLNKENIVKAHPIPGKIQKAVHDYCFNLKNTLDQRLINIQTAFYSSTTLIGLHMFRTSKVAGKPPLIQALKDTSCRV